MLLRLAICIGAAGLLGPWAEAAPRPQKLVARGTWRAFHIRAAGARQHYAFEATSGCRYRITVESKGLRMPEVLLYVGRATTPHDQARAETPEGPAVLVFDAEQDGVVGLEAGGFSANTGRARIRLETLDWENASTKPHRRVLGPRRDEEPYRVGELLLGEANTWDLHLEPGQPYEVRTSRGTAGGVRLRLVARDGTVLATSDAWRLPGLHFPEMRFRAPVEDGEGKLPRWRLEVEGVWSSAGTYGVMMRPLAADASTTPGDVDLPPPVTRGRDTEEAYGFTLQEGDLAVLWMPEGVPWPQRPVQRLLRGQWADATSHGNIARGRRDGLGNFASFRPHQQGRYRFAARAGMAPDAEGATLRLYGHEDLGPAPVHMGTGADPFARARTHSRWKAVGLGICTPGITYLYVLRGAPNAGVGMRVASLEGKVLATRPTRGAALPHAPGYGPSLRFRVKTPSVVRLEARGGKRVVSALLRELENSD